MKLVYSLETDIRIPDHLYSEVDAIVRSHLKKYYEEQLLINANLIQLTSQEKHQFENTERHCHLKLNYIGAQCPLYHKKSKGVYSGRLQYLRPPSSTLSRKKFCNTSNANRP